MNRRGVIIIPLHRGPLAGNCSHRHALARAEIGAAEAVARHQHHAADAGRSGGAARGGDAPDRERGALGTVGAIFQLGDARKIRVEQIEIGKVVRQSVRVG